MTLFYIYYDYGFQVSTYYQLFPVLLRIISYCLMVRWYCHNYSSVHQSYQRSILMRSVIIYLFFHICLIFVCREDFVRCIYTNYFVSLRTSDHSLNNTVHSMDPWRNSLFINCQGEQMFPSYPLCMQLVR